MTSGAGSESSKRYSAVKTRIFVLDLVTTAAALVAFQLFIVREATLFAEGIWPGFYGTRLVLAGIFFVYLYIVALPIRITRSFVIEKVYGLSDRTFSSWAKDELKSLALSFLMLFASVTAFYCTMRYTGKYWWLVSAAAWMIFSVVMTRLFPAFIIPLFYKYSPLKDETLKGKIQSLSDRTGIFVEDICLIDMSKKTNKANAALVGLGRTRKVIISDTLADNFTHEEIEAVVAHEFGHFKYKHIWKLLLMSGAATFAAFY
ncbi:MAG: M48 family metalloprotease, partial [Candidatus Omnitrophica bacterium]|nr:M48 family metalloprotease [Candidatus Omnitrophota bacterium]